MRLKKIIFCALLCILCIAVRATETPPANAVVAAPPAPSLSYGDAAILGLVEGVTEYLPISSTGHLILVNEWLGLNVNGDSPAAQQFRHAVNAYTIIIQAGAIAAVIVLYWRKLISILCGFLGKDNAGLMLGRNLILAFLPAAILGPILDKWIEHFLFGPIPVIIALLAGAFYMLFTERWRARKIKYALFYTHQLELHHLSARQCLFIGLLQCVAMWPGMSRSMMTITAGYFVGLNPMRSAEFSFLLGLLTLSAASAYKLLTHGPELVSVIHPGSALLGIFVALISAALAVKWLVSYLGRHGLWLFAWYRIALALIVSAIIFS